MKIGKYTWLVQLAWAMPDLLAAMSAHPVAATALMGFAYLMTREQQ